MSSQKYKKIYDLQAGVRSSDRVLSSFDDDDDGITLLRDDPKDPAGCTKIRFCGITLSVILIFASGYIARVLMENFLFPEPQHQITNIAEIIAGSKIREYHVELTRRTHLAGSAANYHLAEYLRETFTALQFDDVTIRNYTIRLPLPDPDNPNSVRLLDGGEEGRVLHVCAEREEPLTEFEKNNPTTPLFNGWSKPGTVKRPYVYVNAGSNSDFKFLIDNGVSVKGKIVLLRYGSMFRGNQAENALRHGAIAVVFFKDLDNPEAEVRYPESEWAPDGAGARGSVKVPNGDQDTLGWPARPSSYKNKTSLYVDIITQPITGKDARVLLQKLPSNSTFPMPASWVPKLLDDSEFGVSSSIPDGPLLEVTVNSKETVINASNVIGTIYGSTEPDRWIILGNHRDAWTYGGIDPSSGTAAMMEVGRALSHFMDLGWRPRRTIKLCSWDAEEWGLMGSLEWVEDYRLELRDKAVLYVNTDVAEGGACTAVAASGSPLFKKPILDVIKRDAVNKDLPEDSDIFKSVEISGSGSDYFGFYSYAGSSVVDLECISSFNVYHTAYDTQLFFDVIDPGYSHLASLTTTLARMVTSVSEPALLPLDVTDFSSAISSWWNDLKPKLIQVCKKKGMDVGMVGLVEKEITRLSTAAQEFQKNLDDKTKKGIKDLKDLEIRAFNDKMLRFERAFLVDGPVLGGSFYSRNILMSPSPSDIYAASGFPSLRHIISNPGLSKETILLEFEKIKLALTSAIKTISDH